MSGQAQVKPKSMILVPYHKQVSDRLLESTKNSPNPVFLSAPEQLQIHNHSFITDKNGNRIPTRWYKGCTTIILSEQKAQEKANQEKPRTIDLKDTIFIKNGMQEFFNEGADKLLFEFLEKHNDNVSNPDRVKPDEEGYNAFMQLDPQGDARKELDEMETLELAFARLNKVKKGILATREFDSGQMSKLKSVFGITASSDEESYLELKKIAQGNPKEFLTRIEKVEGHILIAFEAAKKAGVITFKNKVFYIGEEKVFTPSSDDPKKMDSEFLEFISLGKGTITFNKMAELTDQALMEAK